MSRAGAFSWLAALLLVGCGSAPASSLTVSVASSLADVIADLGRRYEAGGGAVVQVNAAASNTLARQIADGAPVDCFISADAAQMKVVEDAGRTVHVVPLLTNQLVVIAPQGSALDLSDRANLTAVTRLAMGEPNSVPAGVYGRQWLEKVGLWSRLQPKVVPLPTVRAALAAVREGRADAAIVYATDVQRTPEVRVVYRVPAGEGPPVVYPAAVVRGAHEDEARRFLSFLRSDAASAVFQAAGFGVIR